MRFCRKVYFFLFVYLIGVFIQWTKLDDDHYQRLYDYIILIFLQSYSFCNTSDLPEEVRLQCGLQNFQNWFQNGLSRWLLRTIKRSKHVLQQDLIEDEFKLGSSSTKVYKHLPDNETVQTIHSSSAKEVCKIFDIVSIT